MKVILDLQTVSGIKEKNVSAIVELNENNIVQCAEYYNSNYISKTIAYAKKMCKEKHTSWASDAIRVHIAFAAMSQNKRDGSAFVFNLVNRYTHEQYPEVGRYFVVAPVINTDDKPDGMIVQRSAVLEADIKINDLYKNLNDLQRTIYRIRNISKTEPVAENEIDALNEELRSLFASWDALKIEANAIPADFAEGVA